jgi:pyrroloquinoline quinone (PQQ) biosynthesis protein C
MNESVQKSLAELQQDLLTLEIQMGEVLEDLIQSLERSYAELTEQSKQAIMQFFATVRDVEGTFSHMLTQQALKVYDEKYNAEVYITIYFMPMFMWALQTMWAHCSLVDAFGGGYPVQARPSIPARKII